jgi:ATP-binding cassette subfamily F protein 3
MLKVENLTKSYGTNTLFQEVTLNINQGERVGLVGRNGHGKTTLLRIITAEESADQGKVSVPRGYRVGHLRQLLDFTGDTVLDEACLGLSDENRHERWKAEKILAGLGFSSEDMSRPPSEFSGGYQVRLNLARLLVSEPDLLLLDEPTNYLDITAIRWLEGFFRSWRGELLVITHDRSFMDRVTTHTMGIHRTRIKKVPGDTEKYYNQIALEEEIHEKSRVNIEKKRRQTEEFITKFRAKARLVGLVQSRIKTLEKQEVPEELERIHTLDFNFRYAPFRPKLLMEAHDLSYAWSSEQGDLFKELSLVVGKGDRVGVIGPNGRGKTTLLRVLAGELDPTSGEVKGHQHLAAGYYGQTNVDRLHPGRTVVEEVQAADPENSVQRARSICGTMMFSGDDALKTISVLSGGERSRVLLARLLLEPHNLLLLDEPTNHLDMDSCEALLEALSEFEGGLIITHNELFLHTLADRLVVFDGGEVKLFEGSYRNFLDEVGWRSEEETAGKRDPAGKKQPVAGKKESRKARAAIIQERSRVLKPLEDRQHELESRIQETEEVLELNEEKLVAASGSGDAQALATLSRERAQLEEELEKLYEELFEAAEELESQRQGYEDQQC